MRVLVVTTSYPRSDDDPAGHFVRAEVRAMEARGDDVTVLAPRGDSFAWPGVVAQVRDRPTKFFHASRELARLRREAREACRAAHGAWDRAVAHWGAATWWIARGLAREIDVVSHGADVRAILELPPLARDAWVWKVARDASSWRFVSEALREQLVERLGTRARDAVLRIARVEAPLLEIDAEAAHHEGARLRSEHRGAPVIYASVGRLVASKRVDRAIDYVARAAPSARLLVVGDGPLRASLTELAARRGVDACFLGLVSRQRALGCIAAADALLFASEAEGLSSVVREASLLGTRVLRV